MKKVYRLKELIETHGNYIQSSCLEKWIKNYVNFLRKSKYIKFCIKIVGLNRSYIQQIRNQSENNDVPDEPE